MAHLAIFGHGAPCEMPASPAHLTARAVVPVLRALTKAGVDPRTVLAGAGLSNDEPFAFDRRISAAQACVVWDLAAELSGDATIGLRSALLVEAGDFDVLDFAMASAATFGDALQIMQRYQRLVHSTAAMTLVDRGESVDCDLLSIRDHAVSNQFVEYMLASWAVVTRRLLGSEIRWLEVRFAHPEPADTSLHKEVFTAPLRFGMAYDGVSGDARALQLPILSAAPGLLVVLERHAAELLQRLPVADPFVQLVRARIAVELGSDVADRSCCATAKHFGMSARSLRRRLQGLGVRYSDLHDQVRQDVAFGLFRQAEHSNEEVAFLTGYDDLGGLQRAIRRWTGKTLAQWRAECRTR